ncbi:hypothetical protein OG552_34325 [Streptomyces sp. NBC_01476]|uniref:hypothetical protein n=1 Tax=Streptomyces sp. NBC_01476 TaxID=2903881 RepID=UPI002E32DCB3|nr:hypothetical protein [Streptomyces sp. NBC_01476]
MPKEPPQRIKNWPRSSVRRWGRSYVRRLTFAVGARLHWYRTEDNVQAKIPSLSTYMGRREPACTYWYLSAAPELLALAAARRDGIRKAGRP